MSCTFLYQGQAVAPILSVQVSLFILPKLTSVEAVGMGSNKMANSLMFLAYASSDGKNVTLSPRLSTSHKEPVCTSNITFDILDGTGISSNIMTVLSQLGSELNRYPEHNSKLHLRVLSEGPSEFRFDDCWYTTARNIWGSTDGFDKGYWDCWIAEHSFSQ